MIIVKQKPLNEILKMTQNFSNILIAGCAGCPSVHQLGGKKQAEILKDRLEEVSEKKVTVVFLSRQCVRQIVERSLRPMIRDHDAILSMGCGCGVQTLAAVFEEKPAIPAHDTEFIGMEDRKLGRFFELCSACGDCILFETGGICPVTRCAKGMMNGPCGGCIEGKCEVPFEIRDEKGNVIETIKNDCAWYLIYEKLKRTDRLDLFRKYRPPRNRAISSPPRML